MQVYAIVSQTGGVGKSTGSWGVAWRYARRNPDKRVLFVDMTKKQGTRSGRICPQVEASGNGLGRALNIAFSVIDPRMSFYDQAEDIADGLDRAASIARTSIVPVWSDVTGEVKVDLLPAASARLYNVIQDKWKEPEVGMILKGFLKRFENEYDMVIFDVTPDIGCVSVKSAMRIADGIVSIQSVKSMDAIEGVNHLYGSVEEVQGTFCGFIGNLYYPKRSVSKGALRRLCEVSIASNLPLLRVIEDRGSIANTTEVSYTEAGVAVSGLYAQLFTSTNPSVQNALKDFEADLDVIIDALEGNKPRCIAQDMLDTLNKKNKDAQGIAPEGEQVIA